MALREAQLPGDPRQKAALSLGSVPPPVAAAFLCGGRAVRQ